jgi:hypothetical protein
MTDVDKLKVLWLKIAAAITVLRSESKRQRREIKNMKMVMSKSKWDDFQARMRADRRESELQETLANMIQEHQLK